MLDVVAAKKAGYTDQEIQEYLASKGQNVVTGQQGQSDGLITSIVKGLVSPFVNTGKNIAGAGYEVYRAGKQALGDKNAYFNQETQQVVQNPFLSESELVDVSKPLSLNKDSALRKQISDSASVASWAIPFGKGTGIMQKAIIPGAKVGALQSIRPDVKLEELPVKMGVGAVEGASMAGGLYFGGKALSGAKNYLTKTGKAVESGGKNITQGVRQIRLKPEVGGAQKEDLINQTLDDLGFKGTPQQQYSMLQPKMSQLESSIKTKLSSSNLTFDRNLIKQDIITQLDNEGLLVGKESKKIASKVVDDVMNDIVGKKSGKGVSGLDLFSIKQKLNKISQRVQDKSDRGVTITPREEVLASTRDALDSIIAKYYPDVKALTLTQSRLFDAARPLGSARSNPPTLRILGASLPAGVTNRTKSLTGQAAEKTGSLISAFGSKLPQIPDVSSNILNIGARVPTLLENGGQEQDYGANQDINNGYGYDQTNSKLDSSQNHGSIVPQKYQPLNPYGATIEELGQLVNLAQMSGDTVATDQLSKLYERELANEKRMYEIQDRVTKANAPEKRTEAQQASIDAEQLATLAIRQLNAGGIKTGPIDPRIENVKSIINMGDQATLDFNNTISQIKATIAKARAGTSFTPNEEKLLNQYSPVVGDSYQQLRTKLYGLQQFFARRNNPAIISNEAGDLLSTFTTNN